MQTDHDLNGQLEQMWEAESRHIRRMLVGLTRDIDLADDLLQETYLKAARGIESYRGGGARAWLSTIARNTFLARLRHRYVHAEISNSETDYADHYTRVGNIDHLELIQIRQAINKLDSDVRNALLMKHYCGFTYQEIAGKTGCPVGTVKWRVSQAVGALKQALGVVEEPMKFSCADLNRVRMLDYLYGALLPDELDGVERHLRGCNRCRNRLDATARVLAALDALDGENKMLQIVELSDDGLPTLYSAYNYHNDTDQPVSSVGFMADKDNQLVYFSAGGEELSVMREENESSEFVNTCHYKTDLFKPIPPGQTYEILCVFQLPGERAAVRGEDGCWTFHWAQLPSYRHNYAFVLAIRLPRGAHVVSADPSWVEVKGSSLMWRSVLAPGEQFTCDIRYCFGPTKQ